MATQECKHDWIVTTTEDNLPEDVMCEKCKAVVIMVDHEE